MAGYTKLFNSILDSTIWQESNETRLLWITMLAMSDKDGEVMASIPGLAKRAGISIEECQHGLEVLSSPDKFSRTPDNEGRRIAVVPGGWRLLNHGRYRELLSLEERREYNRKKQAEWREKNRTKGVNDMSMTVNHNEQCQDITDSRVQITDTEKENIEKPSGFSPSLSGKTDLDSLASRIASLVPKWSPYLNGDERAALYDNRHKWQDLTEDDWDLLARWYADKSERSSYRLKIKARLIAEVDQELAKAAEVLNTREEVRNF